MASSAMTEPLSETDLSILVTLLQNAASKWSPIGDALGFPPGELSNIPGMPLLLNKGDEGFLRELLTRWLKWAPPQHQLPTLEALVQALQTVGEERIAYDLPRQFQQRKQQQYDYPGIGIGGPIGVVGAAYAGHGIGGPIQGAVGGGVVGAAYAGHGIGGLIQGAVGGGVVGAVVTGGGLKLADSSAMLVPRDGREWYHGRISEDVAERRLMSAPIDCFLVRDSASRPGNYTLSMKHNGEFKQFQIVVTYGSYEVRGSGKSFGSLEELVHFYERCSLSADGEKLLTPCAQQDDPQGRGVGGGVGGGVFGEGLMTTKNLQKFW